jgi:hypothetical protein
MSKLSESVGELIVEANMETLREAAKVVFGASLKEYVEDGKTIFALESPICQPRIIVEKIAEGKYRITCRSKCMIKDCPYWERCVKIDNERLKTYEIALRKIMGKDIVKERKYTWIPERVREEEIEKIIDRIIRIK